ncbi:MAG: ABC transporter ATP-binding protein [Candidatus Bathyarchaeia archaeon]
MPNIRLEQVSKRFGIIEALDELNLEISTGEYVCILGPTGSGKTTLLRVVAGLVRQDSGDIFFDGKLVNDLAPEERNVAYLPQLYSLFPHMTVLDNVAFAPLARGVSSNEAYERAHKVLEMVGLSHRVDAKPQELSGGMQQRVALARALASGAGILLLDEPLGALDARLRVALRYQLKSLVKSMSLTAIHVTHDQREAMVVADKVVILRAGHVEQVGTPYHVYLKPANLFVANFVGETNFLEGTVRKVDSAGAFVSLRDGLLVRVRESTYLPGERVVVAVRQELTQIRPYGWDSVNSLHGEVKAIRFLGDSVRVEVRLLNGDMVNVRVLVSQVDPTLRLGEQVVVTFRPGNALVFSAPFGGLARELEVT